MTLHQEQQLIVGMFHQQPNQTALVRQQAQLARVLYALLEEK